MATPFNEIIRQLPTREKVVGQMSDGTPLTIQVSTLFPEDGDR